MEWIIFSVFHIKYPRQLVYTDDAIRIQNRSILEWDAVVAAKPLAGLGSYFMKSLTARRRRNIEDEHKAWIAEKDSPNA